MDGLTINELNVPPWIYNVLTARMQLEKRVPNSGKGKPSRISGSSKEKAENSSRRYPIDNKHLNR
jgi:hypothetical protein